MRAKFCTLSVLLCVAIHPQGIAPELSIMRGHVVGFQTETNLFYACSEHDTGTIMPTVNRSASEG